MATNTTYAIYWVPPGQTMSPNYQGIIDGFFQNVAAASGLSSTVYGSDTQYYMGSNPQVFIQASSTFGGSFVDTSSPIPSGSCNGQYTATIASHLTGCITDSQIQTEIEHVLGVTGWTPSPTKLFLLFTPRSVGSCADASSGTCAYTFYCAYHSDYVDSQGDVLYANQPYTETGQLGLPGACDSGQHPNGDWADATLNVASHEHNEAVTDPDGNAWYDSSGNEDGDKCAWNFGTSVGSTGFGQYNQMIGTGKYYLQQEWSNASSSCVLGYGPAGAPLNTSPPSIGGSASQGQTLTAAPGSWTGSPAPTFAYQWLRCDTAGVNCAPITGAAGQSYLLAAADIGSTIVAQVTGSNSAGSASASSSQSAVVGSSGGAGPTTPVLDSFNRANGGAGANWSLIRPTSFAAMNVAGNAAVDASTTVRLELLERRDLRPRHRGLRHDQQLRGLRHDPDRCPRQQRRHHHPIGLLRLGQLDRHLVDPTHRQEAHPSPSPPAQPRPSPAATSSRSGSSAHSSPHSTTQPAAAGHQVLSYDTTPDTIRYTAAGRIALEFKTSTLDDLGGGTLTGRARR